MKPWTVLTNLHDRELLAQIEAVDAFMDQMHAYPGRTFGQLYHRFFRTNDLADGGSRSASGRSTSPTSACPCSRSRAAGTGSRRSPRAITWRAADRRAVRAARDRARAATWAC